MRNENWKKVLAVFVAALVVLVAFVVVIGAPNVSGGNTPTERFVGFDNGSTNWETGDLGKNYTEGDFVSYQLRIDSASKIWGASQFNISYNFYQSSSDAIYVDGFDTCNVTGFQFSTQDFIPDGQSTPSSGWGTPIATPEAGGTISSSNDPQIINYMHAWPAGSSDTGSTPSTERYFTVANLPWSSFTDHVILYFRAHLALHIIWSNGLEKDLPQKLSGDVFSTWTAKHNGASFATGSSRHFTLQYAGIGAKTIPIPIANYPQLVIEGHKYLNGALINNWEISLKGNLSLGPYLPPIPYNPGSVLTGTSPDASNPWPTGYFQYSGLIAGTFNLTETLYNYQCQQIKTYPPGFQLKQDVEGGWVTLLIPSEQTAINVTVDFYNVAKGSIDGYKFEDKDLNLGTTADDAAVQGWPIYLYRADGTTLIATNYTDSNGYYKFSQLMSGTYIVKEGTIDGWYSVSPSQVTVVLGSTAYGHADFVNAQKGKISGYKYNDTDLSTSTTSDDMGVSGWTISLYKLTNGAYSYVTQTVTDSNGYYSFEGLMPGTYKVVEGANSQWYGISSGEAIVTFTQSHQTLNVNFYNAERMTIEGYKFNDHDLNPTTTSDDTPMAGWTIDLIQNGNVIATTTTDASGHYSFNNLVGGTYVVSEEMQSGWFNTSSTEQTVVLDVSGKDVSVNFYNAQKMSIYGYKYEDMDWSGTFTTGDKVVEGWTIELWQNNAKINSTTTGADGYYVFTDLMPGDYAVKEVSQPGWQAVALTSYTVTLGASGESKQVNFFNARLMSIAGYKYNDVDLDTRTSGDDIAVDGWTIELWQNDVMINSTTTDASGYYCFSELTPGNYMVKEGARDGWFNVSSMEQTVTLSTSGQSVTVNFYNAQLMSINGHKYEDMDWSGNLTTGDVLVQGWTVQLWMNEVMINSTTTDANGYYEFTGLAPGTYYVKEGSASGWTNITPSQVAVVLDVSGESQSVNFFNAQLMSIIGHKYEDMDLSDTYNTGDRPVEGWTIELWKNDVKIAETQTDANGLFSFTGLTPGNYQVKEGNRAGWFNVTANERSVSLGTSGQSVEVNFFNAQLMQISGYKYEDKDLSGGLTDGDVAVPDWTIYLYAGDGTTLLYTTTTDSTGHYAFTGLSPGTYVVIEGSRSGWYNTAPTTRTVTLGTSGENYGVNFFNAKLMSINGYKYNDVDLNTSTTSDDIAVPGWTVELWQNGTKIATTNTDENGHYFFTGLMPGDYTVKEVMQVGWFNVTADQQNVTLSVSGQSELVSFYNARLGSITGYKYEDVDLSGTYSTGDIAVPGWTIEIWQNNVMINSTTTDANGYYEFTNLMPGTYVVKEGDKAGWFNVSADQKSVVLGTSGQSGTVDFFNAQLMQISGYKYEDKDLSGNKTPGDAPVSGWVIYLYEGDGTTLLSTTTTDSTGHYDFNNLLPGTYVVKEGSLDTWFNTAPTSQTVTLNASGENYQVNFFNAQKMSISGYKYEDVDLNASTSGDDKVVSGWTIELWLNDQMVNSTVTDSNGMYQFSNLMPGDYTVKEETRSTWFNVSSTAVEVVLDQSGEAGAANFYNAQKMSINGYKYEDVDLSGNLTAGDNVVPGWTIELWQNDVMINSTMTDENGKYSFVGLLPGTYIVKEGSAAGWFNTAPTSSEVILSSSGQSVEVDFFNAKLGSISGYKYNDVDLNPLTTGDDIAVSGWTVELWQNGVQIATTTTDAKGFYSFDNLMPGTYMVEEGSQAGWFNVTSAQETVALSVSGQSVTVNFYNAQLMSICGYKYEDVDWSGNLTPGDIPVAGWTVELWQNDNMIASIVTDANGYYEFTNLMPGTYVVKEGTSSGWTNITSSQATVVLDVSGETQTADFFNARLMSVAGHKYEDKDLSGNFTTGDIPVEGWVIELWNGDIKLATTTTDANGYYSFIGLTPGTYMVKEGSQAGWFNVTSDQKSVELTTSGQSVIVDFFNARLMQISGYKYEDMDLNPTTVSDDRIVAGWTIELWLNDQMVNSTVTDANGMYVFDNLMPGEYTVKEVLQSNWFNVTQTEVGVVLDKSGQTGVANFYNAQKMSITGYKYEDKDLNGCLTPGDVPITGWTIELWSNGVMIGTTNTDASGKYAFTALMPGSYVVKEGSVAGWFNTAPMSVEITLNGSGETQEVNFFNAKLMEIHGYKYEDVDLSGTLTTGDIAVQGWTINLVQNGTIVNSTTTDANGYYSFSGLMPGEYYVEEGTMDHWFAVSPTQQVCVVFDHSGQSEMVNFFNAKKMIISGYKYNDVDLSGNLTSGDEPIAGWPINLYLNGQQVGSTVYTDSSGYYEFTDLMPGTYVVEEGSLPGYFNTSDVSRTVVLDVSGEHACANFFNAKLMEINGHKYEDKDLSGNFTTGDIPVEGWTVQLEDSFGNVLTTTTDANGSYSFANLMPGQYKVIEGSRDGWYNVSADQVTVSLTTSGQKVDVDFFNAKLMSINGYKYEDVDLSGGLTSGDKPVTGWTVELWQNDERIATTTTDANGYYSFSGLMPGTYVVKECSAPGWFNTAPTSKEVILSSSGQSVEVDFFNAKLCSISGYKYEDVDLTPGTTGDDIAVPGWAVELWQNDSMIASTTTNVSGFYSFTGLMPGTYVVKEVMQTGWFATSLSEVTVSLGSSGDAGSVNFYNARLMTITAYKYEDMDWSGNLTTGDKVVQGWTMELWTCGGEFVASGITDANGEVVFSNLMPGEYVIREGSQVGWYNTSSSEEQVNLFLSGQSTAVDFFNAKLMEINGYKYEDMDLSGNLSTGDIGVQGWTVELWKDGAKIDTTTTDSSGFYSFTGLKPGNYLVKEDMQSGWYATGNDEANAALNTSGEKVGIDFFNARLMSISGYKYNDVDLIPGTTTDDVPFAGWTIELWLNDTKIATTTTDSNGYYEFTGLMPGTYVVKEGSMPGYFPTASTTVTVVLDRSGETGTADFFNARLMKICGFKYEDVDLSGDLSYGDKNVSGWTIYLIKGDEVVATTTTDGQGHYSFDDLMPGAYTVREDTADTNWFSTSTSEVNILLNESGQIANADFFNAQKMSICGYKYVDVDLDPKTAGDDVAYAGWTIMLYKEEDSAWILLTQTVTDSNGYYEFTGLMPGNYKVVEAENQHWYSTSQTDVTVTLNVSGEKTTVNFYNAEKMKICGYKYEDVNLSGGLTSGDKPVSGWTIELWQNDGIIATTTTDANGYYSFEDLMPGTYMVKEVMQTGWYAEFSDTQTIVLDSSGMVGNADFFNIQYMEINGYKYEDMDWSGNLSSGDEPISGWIIQLYDEQGNLVRNTTTDASGYFSFTGLMPGIYTVAEENHSGWYATSSSAYEKTLNVSGQKESVYFLNAQLMTISGHKFEDMNLDGRFTSGEDIPVAGFIIELWQDGSWKETTTTDSNGYYEFTGLMPGNYEVREFAPNGEEGNWYSVSPADVAVQLGTSGQQATVDFYNARLMSICGYKYEDYDLNISTTDDQTPVEGWTIELWLDGNMINSTNTDSSGYYCFDHLMPGDYTVVEVVPASGWFALGEISKAVVLDRSGEQAQVNFYNAQLMSICGYKYEDMDWSGNLTPGDIPVAGWTVELWRPGDITPFMTTTTNDTGYYCFENLMPGTYIVKEGSVTGWVNVSDGSKEVMLQYSGEVATVNFFNARLMTICATKMEDSDIDLNTTWDDHPVEGWMMTLYRFVDDSWVQVDAKATDVNGNVCFTGLMPGTYKVVEENRAGWVAEKATEFSVTLNTSGQTAEFTFVNVDLTFPGGHTIGFWKTNIGKNLGYQSGHAQVSTSDILTYLASIDAKYGDNYVFLDGLTMAQAYKILSIPDASNMQQKAEAQILALVLTAEYRGDQFTTAWVYLPNVGQGSTFNGDGQGAIDYILSLYGSGEYAAAQWLADGINNAPADVNWYLYWS